MMSALRRQRAFTAKFAYADGVHEVRLCIRGKCLHPCVQLCSFDACVCVCARYVSYVPYVAPMFAKVFSCSRMHVCVVCPL